jgi:hypothetical protein
LTIKDKIAQKKHNRTNVPPEGLGSMRKIQSEFLLSALGGLICLASLLLPWYSITVQAFGLGSSQGSLFDEYTYWSTLPISNPQAAVTLDANTKLMTTASVLILVMAGGVFGLVGARWRVARLAGCLCIAGGLGVFEFALRPFGNQATGMVVNTTPSWGFFIAILSVLTLLVAFFYKHRV